MLQLAIDEKKSQNGIKLISPCWNKGLGKCSITGNIRILLKGFQNFFNSVLPKHECEDVKHVETSKFSVTWKTCILFSFVHHYSICFSFKYFFALTNYSETFQKIQWSSLKFILILILVINGILKIASSVTAKI